jgi:hypothetical protein
MKIIRKKRRVEVYIVRIDIRILYNLSKRYIFQSLKLLTSGGVAEALHLFLLKMLYS